ncbi:PHP domain-containing protein [Alteromonas sp. a30]|uniref:PHP domain-containing protein n=1 Tax=Alteromonas sp. a30 TaxID=2730917 RepID=UPI00227FCE78|nr:PHP domain-containing protein [Alteromonas sp. a30]MCY7295159.1 PHP domain-containing protein [Alteromonas sp. a30]
MSKIDLHCHTLYSDGALAPAELLMRAHNQQVDVLAITDHDTVDAISEIIALQSAEKRELHIIPGVEISTAWHGFDIHILGLNVHWQDAQFTQRLAQQQSTRLQRAEEMAEKLEKAGCEGIFETAQKLAGKGQITRAHFARALIASGKVSHFQQAFKQYLAKGKRAFVKPNWISVIEAVQWITDAGGTAVLAHPSRYDLSAKWLRRLMLEFKEAGGEGIEVMYPGLSPSLKNQLAMYAKEYGFYGSMGSDFHAPGRWCELGRHLSMPEHVIPVWDAWSETTKMQVNA